MARPQAVAEGVHIQRKLRIAAPVIALAFIGVGVWQVTHPSHPPRALIVGVDDDALKWTPFPLTVVRRQQSVGAGAVRVWVPWRGEIAPTAVRRDELSRAETAARRGKQPSGSTAPKAESSSVRSAIERRSGRGDVLAVFDVDGTLVETNVVEYYLWMRLRAQPLEEWPSFMARMLRKGPRWLYLEQGRLG